MTGIARPTGTPADWPDFPEVTALRTDEPLPADQWPPLDLTWKTVTPHALHPDMGDRIESWLIQPGAPGPVAFVCWHRFNRTYPYGWSCGVYVVGVNASHDCWRWGIDRTPDEARARALQHVTDLHPDAAVPYAPRVLRARRFYA